MKNITLRQIKAFAMVARHLSFSRAARELHTSQPAISAQIRHLEEETGVQLFERLKRGIALTEAGEEFNRFAARLTGLIDETRDAMDAYRGVKSGTLKVGAVSTAKYFAPSLVTAFSAMHADITVRFYVGNLAEIARQLSTNEVDLVITGPMLPGIEVSATSIATHPYAIVAAPTHPMRARRKIRLQALADESFIEREPGARTRIHMEQLFRKHRVRSNIVMESTSNETIKQAVMAGMGISFLSLHTASLELSTKKLVVLDVVGLPIMSNWHVVHLRGRKLSPLASAFHEFLVTEGAAIVERTTGIRQ